MRNEGEAPKRFWAKHKTQAFLRLLCGEDIEHLSRDFGVTAGHCPSGGTANYRLSAGGLIRPGMGGLIRPVSEIPAGSDFP